MKDKIKTSIVVDRRLWEEFKAKVSREKGLKMLSSAVEEALREEVVEILVINVLEKMLGSEGEIPITISPVKPRTPTDSGRVVREMRDSRS